MNISTLNMDYNTKVKFFSDYTKLRSIINNTNNNSKHKSSIERCIELFYTKWNKIIKDTDLLKYEVEFLLDSFNEKITVSTVLEEEELNLID